LRHYAAADLVLRIVTRLALCFSPLFLVRLVSPFEACSPCWPSVCCVVERLPCVWFAIFGESFPGGGDYGEISVIFAHPKPCGVFSVGSVSVLLLSFIPRLSEVSCL
jgi:hypothetical protein